MGVKLVSSSGGSVELVAPTTASNFTATMPANTGTVITTASTFAGTGPAFSATRTAAQTPSAATWTKVQFSTEEYDTASCYDPTTNYRFTPNVAGYYLITLTVETNTSSSMAVAIYKNGTMYRQSWSSNPGIGASAVISSIIYMNGSTDYVEPYVYQNNSVALYTGASSYEFSGCLVRAA